MKKRGFYKNFFSIYILLVLQNVLTLSVNLTDNIMLGAYSEISLSGVTAVNQIQFIFQQMLSAFAEGAVILGSQYFGKKDTGSIKKIGNVAMRFGIGIALILFGIVTFFPISVMHIFTTETAIVKEGCVYLSIIRFTYLFFAVTTILLATLRTVQVVKIALMLSIVTLVVNYGINYTLIFGRFGAPRLGVTGAAIGTLAARILECGIVIFYSLKKEKILDLKFRDYFKQMDREILADYGKSNTTNVFGAKPLGHQYCTSNCNFRSYDCTCNCGQQCCLQPVSFSEISSSRCVLHSFCYHWKSSWRGR